MCSHFVPMTKCKKFKVCNPGGSVVKNLPANAGDSGDMGSYCWVEKIPWRRKWQPAPVFLPGEIPQTEPGGLRPSTQAQNI